MKAAKIWLPLKGSRKGSIMNVRVSVVGGEGAGTPYLKNETTPLPLTKKWPPLSMENWSPLPRSDFWKNPNTKKCHWCLCFAFFICYLATALQLRAITEGTTPVVLMNAFVSIFQSKVTGSLVMIPFLGAPPMLPHGLT